MSGNAVKAFVTTGTITKGVKSLVLGVATRTSHWNRSESLVTEDTKAEFKAAIEGDTRELPTQAEKVVMREPQHGADKHFTAVLLDGDNNFIESRHY